MKQLLFFFLLFQVLLSYSQSNEFGVFARNASLFNNGEYSSALASGVSVLHKNKLYAELGIFRNITNESSGVYVYSGYTLKYLPTNNKDGFIFELGLEGGLVPHSINKNTSSNYEWAMFGASIIFVKSISKNIKITIPLLFGATYDGEIGNTVRLILNVSIKV